MLKAQFFPWCFQLEAIMPPDAGQHLHIIRGGRVALRPGHNRPGFDRKARIGDDQFRIEIELLTQTRRRPGRPLAVR